MTDANTSDDSQTKPWLTEVGLTPAEEAAWDNTMAMLGWKAPGFKSIWYKMLAKTHTAGGSKYCAVITDEPGGPLAQTDSRNIIINRAEFFKYSLPGQVFIAAHEIVHNIYGDVELLNRCARLGKVPMHDGTDLPFDEPTMQRAADLRINALLIESRIGMPPKDTQGMRVGHYDDKVSSQASLLDVYRQEYKKKPSQDSGGDQPGAGKGNPGGFDNLMPPGKSTGENPQQAEQDRNQQQWQIAVAAAEILEQANSQGSLSAGLKRMFQEVLEPEVPWVDHIETLINRTVGDGGYDWTKPDEWFVGYDIYQPKPTGRGAGWIVFWGDTSGSRSDAELASNMAECAGIMDDVQPQRLTAVWCDADISYIDEITDPMDLATIKARGTGGGGGTDFQPVLDWIAKQGETPDLFIGFTDGDVSFSKHEPRFPVIWASSTNHKYPWGQVVRVNKRKRT